MPARYIIKGAVPLYPEFRFAEPVDWEIAEGENWAVAGPNGAGKSMLADLLMRRIPLKDGSVEIVTRNGRNAYEAVKFIGFRDIYSIVDCREAYYQQRWNADGRDATPFTRTLFNDDEESACEPLFRRFSLKGALEKHIVSLSSGELRKLLIVRALAKGPDILIIDNPFVGLDEYSRNELAAMLGKLASGRKVQFILLVSDPRDIPGWVDKVLPVNKMSIGKPVGAGKFISGGYKELFPCEKTIGVPFPKKGEVENYKLFAHLEKVTVKYGAKTILDRVDWRVERGEKWALLGANGSGKSTLLSLLYGDNPQAYANRITLFDRRRGTGESIWDIKRRIGFLNSEIHSYYLKDITAEEVVMSGYYDTVGLYSAATDEQHREAGIWLQNFGAGHLAERKFVRLSFGEQRLVMLARTFVKRPSVLILDEPLHGLDYSARRMAGRVINEYSRAKGVTLIYVTHYPEEIPSCVKHVKHLGDR